MRRVLRSGEPIRTPLRDAEQQQAGDRRRARARCGSHRRGPPPPDPRSPGPRLRRRTRRTSIYLNTPYAFPARIPDALTAEEQDSVDSLALYTGEAGGSNHLQATRPQTVGVALANSPAGQAAWIYEKYQAKTDARGLPGDALDVDVMLDAVSLFWLTISAASSARIYWEDYSGGLAGPRLDLPVAVTVFPRDIPRLPRSWIEDTYADLIHLGRAERGGHFAALEQPGILTAEIRAGLRSLRPALAADGCTETPGPLLRQA